MVKKSLCQNKGTKTNLTQDNPGLSGLPGLPLTQDYHNRALNNWTQVHGSFVACVLYGNTETKMVDFTPGHKIERSNIQLFTSMAQRNKIKAPIYFICPVLVTC